MKLSDHLSKAADLLETGGCVAGMFEENGRHCALGALNAVSADYTVAVQLAQLLNLPAANDNYNGGWGTDPLTGRNDAYIYRGRLAAWFNNLVDAGQDAEAIAEFRRAARLAAAQGD